MSTGPLLQVRDLSLDTPAGRPLFRGLTITLGREQVALVGRNGVGKSSLLAVLAGQATPERGQVLCEGRRLLLPQQLPRRDGGSPGELRRAALEQARQAAPDLLLLDEPTRDLDAGSIEWLVGWLQSWRAGLIVVSHDRRLLRCFGEFFLVAESGCRHFQGSFDELLSQLEREDVEHEQKYLRNLNRLAAREKHNAVVRQRRQRKKNVGRLRELRRCTSRARLNENRGYAQESQGRRAVLQEERIDATRGWAKATRRALAVKLPLELPRHEPASGDASPIATLERVSEERGGQVLFADLSLSLCRQRLAVTGPNGSGKTTLLEILAGQRRPARGRATCDAGRVGYIAQHADNWRSRASLMDHVLADGPAPTPESAATVLKMHRFPLALAARPLASLSPGERVRAALICIFQRRPVPELLVLDEPTDHLDFLGVAALQAVLARWRGGLVIASHDPELLREVGIDHVLELGTPAAAESASCTSS